MKRTHLIIFSILYIVVSLFLSLYIGAFNQKDSFHYINIGRFILYGSWTSVFPWNQGIPTTIYGPVYPAFTAFILHLPQPWSSFFIPFIQLLLVGFSALCVYFLTRTYISKKLAPFSAIIFFLLPFNVFYAFFIMSETLSMFLLILYITIVALMFRSKIAIPYATIILLSCVMALTKTIFQYLIPVSIILFFYFEWKKPHRSVPLLINYLINVCCIIGSIALLFYWLNFNHHYYGVWRLTNTVGRHLYMGVVSRAKLLPNQEKPIYKEFRKKVSTEADLTEYSMTVERIFINEFQQGAMNEIDIDKKMGSFATEAIKDNIPQFALFALSNLVTLPLSPAEDHGVLTQLGQKDPTCLEHCPVAPVNNCRIPWDQNLCETVQSNPVFNSIMIFFIQVNRLLQPWVGILLYPLAIIGALYGILKKNILGWIATLSFFFFLGITSPIANTEGRYVLFLYGPYTLLIVFGIEAIRKYITKLRKK